ncbi:MAG TPA: histidine kinase dimerization/phosphoacceptor domain-containing protein [Sporichthyaceae bacterium]|nr:histidine kinase dimerization/phosphoacceptor domain-containing protein [Sporichthyaceae bacterium]
MAGERLALVKLTREQEARRRVQDERLRIARDLHDVIAHTLTTINVQASVAGHLLDSRPEQARHALSVIEEAGRDGIGELRAILGVLRDPGRRRLCRHRRVPGRESISNFCACLSSGSSCRGLKTERTGALRVPTLDDLLRFGL